MIPGLSFVFHDLFCSKYLILSRLNRNIFSVDLPKICLYEDHRCYPFKANGD